MVAEEISFEANVKNRPKTGLVVAALLEDEYNKIGHIRPQSTGTTK